MTVNRPNCFPVKSTKAGMMNFDQAFVELLGHEGGYSNHQDDTGKETNWGITQAVARANGYTGHMRDLSQAQAKAIYRVKYWEAVKAEQLPAAVRYAVFDAAVNSGPIQAIQWLQRAAGVADDGKLGPITMAAVARLDPQLLKGRMLAQRLNFMTKLSTWPTFGKGWARRIASLLGD